MKQSRRKFSASFKAKVAIEAIKERETIHELASKYEVQASQINTWKREFLDNAEAAFTSEKPSWKDDSKDLYLNEILNHFLLFWLLDPSLMPQERFALLTFLH